MAVPGTRLHAVLRVGEREREREREREAQQQTGALFGAMKKAALGGRPKATDPSACNVKVKKYDDVSFHVIGHPLLVRREHARHINHTYHLEKVFYVSTELRSNDGQNVVLYETLPGGIVLDAPIRADGSDASSGQAHPRVDVSVWGSLDAPLNPAVLKATKATAKAKKEVVALNEAMQSAFMCAFGAVHEVMRERLAKKQTSKRRLR